MKRQLVLGGICGLLAGAIGAAPAATASTWRHSDPARDVLVTSYDGREQSEPSVSPSFEQGDLVKATVQHTRWTLQVATTLREFDLPNYDWRLTVVTSRGDRFVIRRSGDSGDGPLPNDITRNGYEFECDGLRVNPTSSGVVARVPRSCLGTPYRVRVGVQTEVDEEIDPELHVGRAGADDLLRVGKVTRHRPAFSPWIASS
jgi:hypothetical protein